MKKTAFQAVYQEAEKDIANTLERIEKRQQQNMRYDDYSIAKVNGEFFAFLDKVFQEKNLSNSFQLQIPPHHVKADFAFETFSLAKMIGKNPAEIAMQITQSFLEENFVYLESIEAAGPFVNIYIKKEKVYQEVLAQIQKTKGEFGKSDVNENRIVVVDYSAPNIAKPIGVGHLRSTIIGQALANIYESTGYCVVKDNHLGDWGTQFGKLLYAYEHWGDQEKIEKNPIVELKDLYVRFNDEAEKNPELKEDARRIFQRLEEGDEKLIEIWKRFLDLSLDDFRKVYARLGVCFDTNIGESYFVQAAKDVVGDCLTKNVCHKDPETGAIVAEIGQLPTFLLQKKDGSSLYITRDLATLKFRIETFKPDTVLYVVGGEQELNFQQLFALAKEIGYLTLEVEAKHIGFGMVLINGKKMSTRRGTLIELDELLRLAVEKSRQILKEKNAELTGAELDEISEIVGIGAIIYNDLRQSRTKNISFDWERMLDLEGGSAPYLQYTFVRIQSILAKVEEALPGSTDIESMRLEDISYAAESEIAIVKKIMQYPAIILKAQQTDSPHDICVFLEELALLFNSFYNEVSIMKTEEESLRKSRIMLASSVASVIKNGLALLSIKVPSKM